MGSIYLHCGLPKTGTSSIQAALVRNQQRLEEAGFLYPKPWRRKVDGSHNDLIVPLRANWKSGAGFDEITRLLDQHSNEGDVLLSSEILSTWLLRGDGRPQAVLNLLTAIREVAPLRCVWTLRRFDAMIVSLRIQLMLVGFRSDRSVESFLGGPGADRRLFAHIREVEACAADEVVYVKYESEGGHSAKLLRTLGLPANMAAEIERELDTMPQLNVSRTQKQLAAVLNPDTVSTRLGREVRADVIIRAFDWGGFRFDDDRPCSPLGREERQKLHEGALVAAAEFGISQYARFFASEQVGGPLAATNLGPEVLSDEDLNRLAAHLRQTAGKGSMT